MDIESESSETNLVIVTRKDRAKLFCKIYWRLVIIIITPLILLPVPFLGDDNAYKCFYIFLITIIYLIADVLHPCIVALVPIALFTLIGTINKNFITEVCVRNGLLDCLGIMMIIVAIEHSLIHRRVALKLMLIFGCSHYRLSFLLFFWCMFLSMWMSNTMACGLMIPLVKAILTELEKMGILEIYHTVGKAKQKSTRHEQRKLNCNKLTAGISAGETDFKTINLFQTSIKSHPIHYLQNLISFGMLFEFYKHYKISFPRPTDFTIFYFLGIAYSASVGGMGTLVGSQTNQIFKKYCEMIFPYGPNIEFPHFMLLNLPGVLLIETLLYLWMNFYYLGMFRAQSEIALEVGISEEEAQYIKTLLSTQYQQLGKLRFHEAVVCAVVVLIMILQATVGTVYSHTNISSPIIVCALLLFIIPTNIDFLKYCTRRTEEHETLSKNPRKACLNWNLVRNNIHWTILFITGSGCTLFEALKKSHMTDEFEKFLLLFQKWPAPMIGFVVIIFCKIFTEFANNSCVAYCLLPNIARFSVISNVNPHYLMLAATLSCSLPFHLITGTPPNAMVASYVYIPPWKMMHAGIGPSLIAVIVVWFIVTLWSKAIWPDINVFPKWASTHMLNENITFF